MPKTKGRPVTNTQPMEEFNLRTTLERVQRFRAAAAEDGITHRQMGETMIDAYLNRREKRLAKARAKGGE